MELVSGVCRDIDCLTRSCNLLCAAKYKIEFAFEESKRLFEIVTMRRRPSAGKNVHVDQAKPASGFLAREKNRAGISHYPNVADFLVGVRLGNRKLTSQIVRRDCYNVLRR